MNATTGAFSSAAGKEFSAENDEATPPSPHNTKGILEFQLLFCSRLSVFVFSI
jgi:hypothetical protein